MPSKKHEFLHPKDPRIQELNRQSGLLMDYLRGMERVRGQYSDEGVTLSAVCRVFIMLGREYGLELPDLLLGVEEIYIDALKDKGEL